MTDPRSSRLNVPGSVFTMTKSLQRRSSRAAVRYAGEGKDACKRHSLRLLRSTACPRGAISTLEDLRLLNNNYSIYEAL